MAGDFIRQLDDSGMGKGQSLAQKVNIDVTLLLLLLALCACSLFILYSASGQNTGMVMRQATYFFLGLIIMFTIAQFHPRWFYMGAPWIYGAVVVALLLVLVMGVGAKGAQRWLSVYGFFRFQPSEMMKIAMPMMMAWYLSSRILPPKFKYIAISLLIVGLPVVLIIRQPDLGTSLLVGASGLLVLLFAGLRWRWVAGAAIVVLAAMPVMWYGVMHDYQKQRVLTFLDPESDPLGAGWNIIQSKIAIGSGGLWGKGWLNGTQSHLDFLPESHTDFIIAVFAEEFGFFGVLALLSMYLLIVLRGLYIAVKAQDSYSRLLAGSITLTFFVYVFVNIGMVSGILPVVGVPLPLVSYGGTSILTLMAGFGVLMSIHTHRKLLTK